MKDSLVALKDRLLRQGVMVKEFYVDNCCAWRSKLQSVFGTELRVPLDIFHAVKRIGDKIPKQHELRRACMEDLRLVFRHPSDRGTERTMMTPTPGRLVWHTSMLIASKSESVHILTYAYNMTI